MVMVNMQSSVGIPLGYFATNSAAATLPFDHSAEVLLCNTIHALQPSSAVTFTGSRPSMTKNAPQPRTLGSGTPTSTPLDIAYTVSQAFLAQMGQPIFTHIRSVLGAALFFGHTTSIP